jgi:quinol-cytochrome oxidoreductase complex cytochrome b subunit
MFQALKYAPATILGVSGEFLVLIPVNLGVVALILLPFLDRNTPRSRRVIKGLATLALIFMIAMTALALLEKAP